MRKEVTWFNDFSCLCGDCPESCCRGWVIPLSDQDCERLQREKGFAGAALFFATGGWSRAKFNTGSGKCPFWEADGLCRLQKKKGHDFIPWTCQSFPRFYRNYGEFEECCLDLSCPGAARLFLENKGSLELTQNGGDPVTQPCSTNDDREYFGFLLRERGSMCTRIRDVFDKKDRNVCAHLTDALFLYSVKLQDIYAKGEDAAAAGMSFDKFIADLPCDDERKPYSFPLPASVLTGILASPINHIRLKRVNPKLYGMFVRASRMLTRLGTDSGWKEAVSRFLNDDPDIIPVLGAYLSYYLFQYFLRVYETYSFRRQIALGLCHMNMILLLLMAESAEGHAADEMLETVIAVYNRRAYFNDDILDDIYRIFESSVPKT